MSANPEGGSAFPVVVPSPNEWHHDTGMTLRDYFAAKAMQSLVNHVYSDGCPGSPKSTAENAYFIADAMLEARAGKEKYLKP